MMNGKFSELTSSSQSENNDELHSNNRSSLNVFIDKASFKRKVECGSPESGISIDLRSGNAPSNTRKYSRKTPHDADSPPFDWQSTKQSLTDRTAYVFDRRAFCDVHFIVGEEPLAQRIPAHKFILSIGSSVFDAMFSGHWASEASDIEVPDVEPAAFLTLVRYLYTDDVSVTGDTVMALLYVAKKYAVPSLEKNCLDFLSDNLHSKNAFTILSQARAFDEQELVNSCLEKIDSCAQQAFFSECFVDVDLETLCSVLERDTLKIPEVELFEAVCRWSNAELARQNLPEDKENQRFVLESVLPLIRFPVMRTHELRSRVEPLGLLSNGEVDSLYRYHFMKPKPAINFNCTPRGLKQLVIINRFDSIKKKVNSISAENSISFCLNRDAVLLGFKLYGALGGSAIYSVLTELSHTSTKHVLSKDSGTYTSDGSVNNYEVLLACPEILKADVSYTLRLNIKGPETYCGTKGKKEVTINMKPRGQVTMSFSDADKVAGFNSTCVKQGQIPEFIFLV